MRPVFTASWNPDRRLMPETPFEQLEALKSSAGNVAVCDRLIDSLRDSGEFHKLFDAQLLKKKFELGLPLSRPASLQDVPEEHRKAVEEVYRASAREVGQLFLQRGDIPSAWMYLQVIREPDSVRQALEALPDAMDDYEKLEPILQIALHQGVHPTKAIRLMLNAHGTCSTITSLDQAMHQLNARQRSECAKLMVRSLYQDLQGSVRRHVESRISMLDPDLTLRALLAGRDWIFESGNYHVDVSHLNSVVRFARSIEAPSEELELALQLAEYGARLDPQLQYGGDPPFDAFYPAHIQFFRAVLDKNRADALQYFRDRLQQEPDEVDRPLLAYVLVDLLMRCDRLAEAVEVASRYLANLNEDVSISFDELCTKAKRMDALKQARQQAGDLVGFASALLREP